MFLWCGCEADSDRPDRLSRMHPLQGDQTMADANQGTGRTSFQVPDEMRNMAERSLTQALESFLRASRQTAETGLRSAGAGIGECFD